MSLLQKILNFINSDLYFYICIFGFLTCLFFLIIVKVIEFIVGYKKNKEWNQLLRKYGVPAEFEAPDYVIVHIFVLIALCEKYNLSSLYDAQDKFEDLYCSYWESKVISEEDNRMIQCEVYQDG